MSEKRFEMETEPLIEQGTNDTPPLTTADMGGAAAAAPRREPISDQTDIDRERGAVDYQSAVGSQPEEDSAPLFEPGALENFWGANPDRVRR